MAASRPALQFRLPHLLRLGYLILLLVHQLNSQRAAKQFKCPQQFGYFQDLDDCNKYFICVFGDALHDKCTPGLYFNNELRMCDWPRNVKTCDGGSSDESSSSEERRRFGAASTVRPKVRVGGNRPSQAKDDEILSPNSIAPPKPTQDTRSGRRYTPPISGESYVAAARNSTHVHYRPPSSLYTKPQSTTTERPQEAQAPASFKPIYVRLTSKSPILHKMPGSHNKRKDYDDTEYYDDDDYDDSDDEPRLILNKNLRINNNVYVTPIDPHTSQKPRLVHPARNPTTRIYPTITAYYPRNTNSATRRPANTSYVSVSSREPVFTSFNLRGPQLNNAVSDSSSEERKPSVYTYNRAQPNRGYSPRPRPTNYRGPPYSEQIGQRSRPSTPASRSTPQDPRARERARDRDQYHQSLESQKDSLDAQFGTNPRAISLPDAPYRQNSFISSSEEKKLNRNQPVRKPPPAPTKYLSPAKPSSLQQGSSESFDDYPEYYYDDDDYYDDDEDDEPIRPKVVIRVQQPSSSTTTSKPSVYSTPSTRRTTTTTTTRRPATARPAKRPLPFGISRPATKRPARLGPKPLPRLPSRPPPLYSTPQPLSLAQKCSPQKCALPDCRCGSTDIPGGLSAQQVPQIVLITFDDAVNDLNYELYAEIFDNRKNPNGCPILGTFYVSHEWTDYGMVQTLYSKGHEMASHSLTHSHGEKFSVNTWKKEIDGQREVLHLYGGVKLEDIRGMRAPFLQVGGNHMFEMLYASNFTYDSSMPVLDNNPPFYPYTLDYGIGHECMIPPCPTKSFPGLWEVGMVMWNDYRGGRCSMGDACANPDNAEDVYKMLLKNFNRHYTTNRAPFGLFYHAAWFTTQHYRKGYLKFIEHINSKEDVYMVTNWQAIQWMREPTPLSHIKSFKPWMCPRDPEKPGPCHHPTSCSISHKGSNRNMKTCQPCPSTYPWTGRTGFDEVYG